METIGQDLRFAARLLAKNKGFTFIAVLTLALGIGANTAIFSVVNSVLLRPLAFRQPEQLYVIREIVPQWAKFAPSLAANLPDFQIWQKECRSFEQLAIAEPFAMNLSGAGEAQEVHGVRGSASLFDTLDVHPSIGRSFRAEEDEAGKDHVVILADSFWRTRFHADPALVGKTLRLDGVPHTVVGILPASFHFPKEVGSFSDFGPRADFFKPLGGPRYYEQSLIGEFDFLAIARLKTGVAPGQALAELNVIQAQIANQARGDTPANERVDLQAELLPLEAEVIGPARRGLLFLLGSVGAILLIVCVNLANLLLARVPGRMREAAIRTALGASRLRLVRQTLTECVLLAIFGGLLGIWLASFGVRWLVHTAPVEIPRLDEVTLDARVLWFAVLLSTLTGLVFGILPAWRVARTDPQEALKSGATTATESQRTRRLRESLVGLEAGVCTLLLILAGLLTASLFHLVRVNTGFHTEKVLAADIELPPQSYSQAAARAHFYDQVLSGIRALPEVRSAGWVSLLPLEGQGSVSDISLPGEQISPEQRPFVNYRAVSFGYLETMGIPLLKGRFFAENDRGKKRIIVSQSVAERLWPGTNPIGRECLAGWGELQRSEVIAVVGDIRTVRLEHAPVPMVYVPDSYGEASPGAPTSASIVVRTATDPASLAGAIREVIHRTDLDVPIVELRPMEQVASESVAGRRFQMRLALLFAFSSLFLAALGIYGVVTYSVEQRRHELGIRMALGARPSNLRWMILRQGMRPVLAGLVIGVTAALFVGRLIQGLLFNVRPFDLVTMSCVTFTVALVALMGCYVPARRATRVDPLVALRYE